MEWEDVPEDVLTALVDDVFRMWQRRGEVPGLTVFCGPRTWGEGPVAVSGALPDVAGWLTGRSPGARLEADGGLPRLPAWL